jgi:hypothetical protein
MADKPTLQTWKEKHPDYRTEIDGQKYVMQLCDDGVTRLVPIEN